MRSGEAVLVLVSLVLIVLLMGKTLGLPLALMLVSGESMKPSLNPFDIVLGVSPKFKGGVNIGEIVVVVLPGKDWRTSGVIHRVVKLYNHNGVKYVVTKGDNVGYDDPPVPLSDVRYVITGRIPNYITIPTLIIILGFIVGYYSFYYPYKRWESGYLPPPGSLAAMIIIVFALFNIAYIGGVYLDSTPNRFALPVSISEKAVEYINNNTVVIELRHTNTSLQGIGKCFFILGGQKFNAEAAIRRFGVPALIQVSIPEDLWVYAWNYTSRRITSLPSYPARIMEFFFLRCQVNFSSGVLKSSYPLKVAWSEPLFEQGSNGSLVIVNNNPVPLHIHLVLFDVDSSKTVLDSNITLPGVDNVAVKLPAGSQGHLVKVLAYYEFLGVKRVYGGSIHG